MSGHYKLQCGSKLTILYLHISHFLNRCGGTEKPPEEEECDPPSGSESCNVPAWIVSDWSGCEGKCGKQNRDYSAVLWHDHFSNLNFIFPSVIPSRNTRRCLDSFANCATQHVFASGLPKFRLAEPFSVLPNFSNKLRRRPCELPLVFQVPEPSVAHSPSNK